MREAKGIFNNLPLAPRVFYRSRPFGPPLKGGVAAVNASVFREGQA
jgi:hypothetical protein